jgi:hypothetical protein
MRFRATVHLSDEEDSASYWTVADRDFERVPTTGEGIEFEGLPFGYGLIDGVIWGLDGSPTFRLSATQGELDRSAMSEAGWNEV